MTEKTISTRLGHVAGFLRNGVSCFLGIRFGQPPTKRLRFRPPQPAPGWTGVYDATRYGNRAVQPPPLTLFPQVTPGVVSEDCLFLNVVTPGCADRHPVLVWLHGGSFTVGSANDYDGCVLASQGDVVVVSVNYRLGLLGFLDLSRYGNDYAGSASNGFRDQILALEWVRDNIEDYGGDPCNVTILGQSAGGASVHALLAAPSADGLFHKAVAHSPGMVSRKPVDRCEQLASSCPGIANWLK